MSALAPLAGLWEPARARAEWALSVARHFGVPVTVTSGVRDQSEQAELRRRWELCGMPTSCSWCPTLRRTVCPANRPGESSHEWGLSWDSDTEPQYREWWTYVRELAGFRVPAGDRVHAEVPGWRELVGR